MDQAGDRCLTPDGLDAILATLSWEIRDPLNNLHAGINALLSRGDARLTDVDRNHARTMQTLCEDLSRLTHQCLGGPKPD